MYSLVARANIYTVFLKFILGSFITEGAVFFILDYVFSYLTCWMFFLSIIQYLDYIVEEVMNVVHKI